MSKEKYVAYISSYTQGDSHGIRIYDVDMKNGRFKEKDKVEITNSSYLTISHNGKFLYSITDFGVEAYTIQPGERVAQLCIAPVYTAAFAQAAELGDTQRGAGGFGSTGK